MAPEDDHDPTRDELRRRVEELEELLADRDVEIESLRLQLAALAVVDAETGLLNRGGLMDAVAMAIQRHARLGEGFGVVAVRLPAEPDGTPLGGAETARHVAALLRATIRELDRAGRLDEATFAVVLTLADEQAAKAPVERILGVLAAAPLVEDVEDAPDPAVGVVLATGLRTPALGEVLGAIARTLAQAADGTPATESL
jgi:GGDEF domain-containing protein